MVVAGGGEVAGRDPGPVRTRWSVQLGLRRRGYCSKRRRAQLAGHGRRGRARSAVAAARRRGNGGGRQRLRSWASRGRGAAIALAAAATRAWPPGNGGHDAGRERQREGGSE